MPMLRGWSLYVARKNESTGHTISPAPTDYDLTCIIELRCCWSICLSLCLLGGRSVVLANFSFQKIF